LICPHCGKETEEKWKPAFARTDWGWEVAKRLRFLEQCGCGFEIIDCTGEISDMIERHSWQRTKKKSP